MKTNSTKPLNKLDIVMSVFNQEHIIERVLFGIFRNTTTPFNLILVFDGCTDKSEQRALSYIKKTKPKNLISTTVEKADNVYETKANNIGFKLSKEEYMITLQDDMIIKEMGWERRLTYPLRKFDDVLAVTSRSAHDIRKIGAGVEDYVNMASREKGTLPRDIFAVRDIINRGPVACRVEYLKNLNYLNENYAPAWLDEADLSLRAWESHKWRVGSFWIDYYSPIELGKTRSSDSTMSWDINNRKNCEQLARDHREYLRQNIKHSEDIKINENEVDYVKDRGTKMSHMYFPIRYNPKTARAVIGKHTAKIKEGIKKTISKANIVTEEEIKKFGIKKLIKRKLKMKK